MYIVDSVYSVVKNEEREFRYTYRLISEDFYNGQAFGIEIERQDLIEGNVVKIERDKIRKISNVKEKVKVILNLVHSNQVSPIHLVDILGEYVDEYVVDFGI